MRIKKTLSCIFVLLIFCLVLSPMAFASGNNRIIIDDMADLFTDEQEKILKTQLESVLPYGNAGIVTRGGHSYGSTDEMAQNLYAYYFGSESGTLFAIDMQYRNIYIYSDGEIYKTITKTRANEITDDTYMYATRGEYYLCASEVFSRITTLLESGRIFSPMKYVAYFLIAFGLAMMICIVIVIIQRRLPKLMKDKRGDEIDGIDTNLPLTIRSIFLKDKVTTRSSGGSGGGHGGGGGGHGGGGGGHGF